MKSAFAAIACAAALACGGEPATQDPATLPEPAAEAPQDAPAETAASEAARPAELPGRTVPTEDLYAADASEEPFGALADARNEAPVVAAVEIAPKGEIHTGDALTAMPRAHDPEGDPITYRYRWSVNGRELRHDAPTLPASEFERGDRIELIVEADDGSSASHPFRTEPIVVANTPPEISSKPGPLEKDGTFRYRIEAQDADEDRSFRYALVAAPEGMKLDPISGAVEWTPSAEQAGTHAVTIEVDDRNEGLVRQAFDLTIEFPGTAPAAPAP